MKKYDLLKIALFLVGLWAIYQGIVISFYIVINLARFILDNFSLENTRTYFVNDIILMAGYFLVAFVVFRQP